MKLYSIRESYVEPNYNGWFNTGEWMHQYAVLQEQQRASQQSDNMPADQADFEQHLNAQELSSSDDSAAEASSPDTHAAQAHEAIQRTDLDDTTRMPPLANLDDWRSSRDVSRFELVGSAAEALQSKSLERLSSSARYTEPSAPQPIAHTNDSRRRGLLSRFTTGVKGLRKVLGPSSGRSLRSASKQQELLSSTEFRVDYAKRGRAIEPFEADRELISRFMRASLGSVFVQTAQRNAAQLDKFSSWLNQHQRQPIADRLHEHRLEADAREYAQQMDPAGGKDIRGQIIEALDNLRHSDLPPAALTDDERLVSEFREAAKSAGRARNTVDGWVTSLRKFGIWLRPTELSSLLDDPGELKRLATLYVEEGNKKDIHGMLKLLQEFHVASIEQRPANFNLHLRQRLATPPAADAALLKRFKTAALQANVSKNTIDSSLIHAKKFANWLHENNREPLAFRYQDEALAGDIEAYKVEGNDNEDRLLSTLTHLRRLLPGEENIQPLGAGPRLMGRRLLHPYPADAAVIDGMLDQALRGLATAKQRQPFHNQASWLRGFSDWLQREGRGSIVGRLSGNRQQHALDEDLELFTESKPRRSNVKRGMAMLRNYLQVVEANRAWGMAFPEQVSCEPRPVGSSSTWSPRVPSDFEWPSPEGTPAREPRPAASGSSWSPRVPSDFEPSMWPSPEGTPAWSSDIYRGLESLVDLPSVSHERGDEVQSAPVRGPAASPPFFIGPSGALQVLDDIGYLVDESWQHGSQRLSDVLIDIMDNQGLLPTRLSGPRQVSIKGETYTIALGPGGRRDAHLVHHPRKSSASDAHIGALDAGASSHERSGQALGEREWLGDEHINRDYKLLTEELRAIDPNLADRTRFVDPLLAFQLSHGAERDALRAFQRIVSNPDDEDTADFLFLPVSDASATDIDRRGSHWSLLLVDRSHRESRPVAYHYDSARGYNDRPAAQLAARLGAIVERPGMAQQRNDYDCGVFVVDGTRELASQLTQGRRQGLLNLDNLVIDRHALQNRLRG